MAIPFFIRQIAGGSASFSWQSGHPPLPPPVASTVALAAVASNAIVITDVVVLFGGTSDGEKDLSRSILTSMGMEIAFAGVRTKPVKPCWHGVPIWSGVAGRPDPTPEEAQVDVTAA